MYVGELTEDQWKIITNGLAMGVPYRFICMKTGIPQRTWYDWLKKGREDRDKGLTTAFATFVHKVEVGQAEYVFKATEAMDNCDKGHKGHEWKLTRRHRDDYHLPNKLEHSGKVDGDHNVTLFDPNVLDQLEDVDEGEE